MRAVALALLFLPAFGYAQNGLGTMPPVVTVLQGVQGPAGPAGPPACGVGDLDASCKVKPSASALTDLGASMSATAVAAAASALSSANPIVTIAPGATGHMTPTHLNGATDDVVPTLSGDASGDTAHSVIMGLRGSFRNLAIANAVPLNTTGDHAAFTITQVLAPFVLKEVDAANCATTPGLAQVSIWTGPGATGTRLVAPTLLSAIPLITGAGQALVASSINSPRQSALTLYLHVDVANLTADTCSFYLQGISALDATQLATTVTGY